MAFQTVPTDPEQDFFLGHSPRVSWERWQADRYLNSSVHGAPAPGPGTESVESTITFFHELQLQMSCACSAVVEASRREAWVPCEGDPRGLGAPDHSLRSGTREPARFFSGLRMRAEGGGGREGKNGLAKLARICA